MRFAIELTIGAVTGIGAIVAYVILQPISDKGLSMIGAALIGSFCVHITMLVITRKRKHM